MTLLPWLLAAALAIAAEPAPPPANDEMITVVAERMRRIKLETKTDRKTHIQRCLIKRSSGDTAFDTMMCNSALACGTTATTKAEMEACMGRRIAAFVASAETPEKKAD